MNKLSILLAFFAISPVSWAAGERTRADEALAAQACRSTAPVLVIDTFPGDPSNEPDIDLAGDGFYNILHGEFVARMVEIRGQQVIRERIGMTVYPEQMLAILDKYADQVEKGQLHLAWINFSQGFAVDIDSLNDLVGLKDEIDYKNVDQYAFQILQALEAARPDLKLKELSDAFARIRKLGVPVILAASNSGYKQMNLYSLFPGVISVGALDLDGTKAAYSADNSAVTLWRRGAVCSYALPGGGIALDNDTKADFPLQTPMVPPALLQQFRGKIADSIVSQIPSVVEAANKDDTTDFFQLLAKLPKGLYSTKDTLSHSLGTLYPQASYIETLGEYFYLDGQRARPLFFAKVNDDGAIVIQQGAVDNAGRQFRNVLYGTSFAAPNLCDGENTPEAYAL